MLAFFLVGRILYGGFLVASGIDHFRYAQVLTVHAGTKGVPAPQIGVMLSGLLIIVGGLSLILGFRPVLGVVCVTLFLVPTTLVIHNYWGDSNAAVRQANLINFRKNVALLGAAWMFLMIPRPWPLSLH
jgi:putative oxidoreductase